MESGRTRAEVGCRNSPRDAQDGAKALAVEEFGGSAVPRRVIPAEKATTWKNAGNHEETRALQGPGDRVGNPSRLRRQVRRSPFCTHGGIAPATAPLLSLPGQLRAKPAFSLKGPVRCGTFPIARAHGMWTYEPRQGRKAATVVCSASAVVTLASFYLKWLTKL